MNRLSETALAVSSLRSLSDATLASRKSLYAALSVVLILVLSPAPASAATIINYGSFMGATVSYESVREAANSAGDTAPLFSEPTVIGVPNPVNYPTAPCVMCAIPGDTLDFDPTGFSARAARGGAHLTDGNLRFVVKAKPLQTISNIKISEFGDTTLIGAGTAATSTFARIAGVVNIQAVGGIGVNSIPLQFSQTLASFSLPGGAGVGTPWSGSVLLDLTTANPAVLAAYIVQGLNPALGVTQASVSFDNTLVATSEG